MIFFFNVKIFYFYIGAAHFEDTKYPSDTNNLQIKKAREHILTYLEQWLTGFYCDERVVIRLENEI